MKYIAFLRGINVGGNNAVSMLALKEILTEAGLQNVTTYINSGNIVFESEESDSSKLAALCTKIMKKRFGFHIDTLVITATEYKAMIASAPKNWGNEDKDLRSDALFIIPPATEQQVLDQVGAVNNEFEWLDAGRGVVFWTVRRSRYTRSRLPKIIGSDVYRKLTMRGASTTRKLLKILDEK